MKILSYAAAFFVMLMMVAAFFNGLQRIMFYSDWTTGITNLGISAILICLCAIALGDDE